MMLMFLKNNFMARTATAMHSKIDAKLKNTAIAKTQAFKDYEKGKTQRKIKAMKQGMPMVDKTKVCEVLSRAQVSDLTF